MLDAWRRAVANLRNPGVWRQYVDLYYEPGLSAQQIVLRAAYSIYNSNSAYGSPDYVRRIERAGSSELVQAVVRDAQALRFRGAVEVRNDC